MNLTETEPIATSPRINGFPAMGGPACPGGQIQRHGGWCDLLSDHFRPALLALLTLAGGWTGTLGAATIYVPNGSFESPATPFAGPEMAGWLKAPEAPGYFDPTGFFPWEALMGQFLNTSNGSPDHIDNLEGQQGGYLFALPGVAILQDYATVEGTNTVPRHRFNTQFEAGKSYALTVALLGGGGGMSNGATFEISLYYRDQASNRVTVAATTVTNAPGMFSTKTHFVDFQVRTPFVQAADAWAGKRLGIQLASTVIDTNLLGGYWDVDNVRLTESVVPNGSFESPAADFANPAMDGWEKAPEAPGYFDPTGFFPWVALMGQFLNTSNGSPDHINNLDGQQAAYLFALPGVAISQDYNTVGGTNSESTHEFNAKFQVGKSYALTVGVIGGGGGMSNGATLGISVYYRDAASNRVSVAGATITNTPALFPSNTEFTDFQALVAVVRAGDAWAGKNIGVQLASTVIDTNLAGGYWDVDDVRLTESVVPNWSFEFPVTDFANPGMDEWQKPTKPTWYVDNTGFFPWEALMGQFVNTSNGNPDHIDNMDGAQGAYLFALPEVAIFQDYISIGGTNSTPTHDFDLKYQVGNAYNLTVGVLGGGGGMSNDVALAISFYYRDAESNRVTIASTTITNSQALFPTNTHLTDFLAQVPTVQAGDAWANKNVGIQLGSTLTLLQTNLFGGYWDVDNVRVQVIRDPVLKGSAVSTNQQFQFTLQSAPGRYEILSSTNLGLPPSSWARLGLFTNQTGSVPVTDTNLGHRFYQARPSP